MALKLRIAFVPYSKLRKILQWSAAFLCPYRQTRSEIPAFPLGLLLNFHTKVWQILNFGAKTLISAPFFLKKIRAEISVISEIGILVF